MLRELLASFNIDTGQAETALRKMDGALEGVKGTIEGLAEAFIGEKLVDGIGEFVKGQIEAGTQLRDTAEKLGVGIDELQAFSYAAKQYGVSNEAAAKGLQFLNKNIGDFTGNTTVAQALGMLHVQTKNADGSFRELGDLIPEVADGFQNLGSDQERTAVAMQLFGRSGAELIPLLKRGGAEVEELYKRFERLGGGLSEDFVNSAHKADDAFNDLHLATNGLKSQIAIVALPAVTWIVEKLAGFAATLRKVEKETNLARDAWIVMGVAGSLAAFKIAAGLARVVGVIPKGGSFWRTFLGLGELGLAIAAVALLALGFEDLWTFMQGGDSVIGDLITKFLGLDEATAFNAELREAWDQIKESMKSIGPPLKEVGAELLKIGVQAAPYVIAAIELIVRAVGSAIVAVATLTGALADFVNGKSLEQIGDRIFKASDAIFGARGLLGDDAFKSNAELAAEQVKNAAPRVPTFTDGPIRGGRPVVVNQTNQVTNNIQGVKDATAAGQAAKNGTKDALGGELQSALGALATGG